MSWHSAQVPFGLVKEMPRGKAPPLTPTTNHFDVLGQIAHFAVNPQLGKVLGRSLQKPALLTLRA